MSYDNCRVPWAYSGFFILKIKDTTLHDIETGPTHMFPKKIQKYILL
jgi:hypothetical protein